ncbi:ubiquitin-like-specific protease 1D isoform X6 [Lycium ferocissimum]|uniref:ubiquitin-like-specific protease 1D isoform X6 n=1 Tax=Lycium ferocissimum TaxID=112874 RepID=UPI002815FCCC|nr:ubiquitin-like-specific protease 1D isoform X6 [Lycium ferocissimum]
MKKGEELGSKGIAIDWDELINNNDDPPAELVVTSAIKHQQFTMDGEEGISHLSITELIDKIARLKKSLSSNIGARLPDGGQKLKANIKLHEDELERRKRVGSQKQAESKPANAFQEELYALNPCDRKSTLNNQFSKRKRHKRESLSQEAHYKFPVDNGEQVLNVDLKGRDSSSRCSEESITICFSEKTKASQARSSYTRRHANGEAVVLVDEGEPDAIKETEQVDQVVERKVTKIYYPSRVDPESVEICCSDMESLAPEAYLSSTIMNFYIRYLQKTKLHADVDAYHFFNTYFYQKLKEAVLTKQNEKEASFVRLRRWWKGVNIFEKAYIFLPIHEDLHWSLVIICIPDKEDQLGPILLHLDSLGLHSSESLFATIRKFLVQEWKFLRQGEVPALPISDKIWENLPRRINENIIPVPQQRNEYDCGLFVLFFMERFIEQVHGRLKKKDFAMFGRRWFKPEEASCLRMKIRCILKIEFKNASED